MPLTSFCAADRRSPNFCVSKNLKTLVKQATQLQTLKKQWNRLNCENKSAIQFGTKIISLKF